MVECKLWRNFEARRKVFAQIVDYAKDLQAISYPDLEKAIRAARKEPAYNLFAGVMQAADDDAALEESDFLDTVSRNLRRGRFLLLVVGDEITEGLEEIATFLDQHAGLHFGLALLQLAVHEVPGTSQILIVLSIPMRVKTSIRGIVEWEGSGIRVVAPRTISEKIPSTLSQEELLAGLDRAKPGTSDRLVEFLESCADLQRNRPPRAADFGIDGVDWMVVGGAGGSARFSPGWGGG